MVDILVNSLGLSVRASNALNRMQIHTLEQLLNTPIEEIKEARNIGAKTVDEIETFCKSYLDGAIEIDTLTKKVYVSEKLKEPFQKMIWKKCLTIISLSLNYRQEQKMDYCV